MTIRKVLFRVAIVLGCIWVTIAIAYAIFYAVMLGYVKQTSQEYSLGEQYDQYESGPREAAHDVIRDLFEDTVELIGENGFKEKTGLVDTYYYLDDMYISKWRNKTKYSIGVQTIDNGKVVLPINITYLDASNVCSKAMKQLENDYIQYREEEELPNISDAIKKSFEQAIEICEPIERTETIYIECEKNYSGLWEASISTNDEDNVLKAIDIASNGTLEYVRNLDYFNIMGI